MKFNVGLCLALLVLPASSLAQDLAPIVDMSTSASTSATVDKSVEPKPYEPVLHQKWLRGATTSCKGFVMKLDCCEVWLKN